VDPAFHPHDLDRLITDFTERVPGVVRALVVSSDGVPVAAQRLRGRPVCGFLCQCPVSGSSDQGQPAVC
jgi:hypothetical protein